MGGGPVGRDSVVLCIAECMKDINDVADTDNSLILLFRAFTVEREE